MNNGDKPAGAYTQPDYHIKGTLGDKPQSEITLREHFAGLAMKGILARLGPDYRAPATTALDAIRHADELLKALGESE